MDLFTQLRQYAITQPEVLADTSRHRRTTYRRFWSRIERATARLQGEWHIQPGDLIAYWGSAHPDALVLYVSLARCGARLLPLEPAAAQFDRNALLAEHRPKRLVHEDGVSVDWCMEGVVATPLSSLISTPCSHHSLVPEDATRPSLLQWQAGDNDRFQIMSCNLYDLTVRAREARSGQHCVANGLFESRVFAPIVLSTLIAGKTLRLG